MTPPVVSKVLHGGGPNIRVSEATRERVQNIARELGYRQNLAARAVRTGKFGAFGLMMSTEHSRSILPETLLFGLIESTDRHGLHLTLTRLPDEKLMEKGAFPHVLEKCMVDGLLINYNADIPEFILERIGRDRISSVWINAKLAHNCVYFDDLRAGREGTQFLLDLGHRRITFANYSGPSHYSAHDRRDGYLEAMKSAGAKPDVVERASPPPPKVLEDVLALLRKKDRPTALFCYYHGTAAVAIRAAHILGLEVPKDLTILTISDAPERFVEHELTVMNLSQERLAEAAVDMLIRQSKGDDGVQAPVVVPIDAPAGGTHAPAPAEA